jgi:hypothetical protein
MVMKLKCLLTAALLLALAPAISAQTTRFNVPFPFVGFDSDFPAGEYQMVLVAGSTFARMYNSQTGQCRAVPVTPNRPFPEVRHGALLFQRYGNLYVLREYESGILGVSQKFPLSKKRQALVQSYMAQGREVERVLVVANR